MTASPYFELALVLVTIPYGTIGLLGLLAGGLWRRGSRLGGPLALVWVLVTGAWITFELVQHWVPRLMAVGQPDVWYNWGLPEIWIPVPLALGVLALVLAGVSRLARVIGPEGCPEQLIQVRRTRDGLWRTGSASAAPTEATLLSPIRLIDPPLTWTSSPLLGTGDSLVADGQPKQNQPVGL